MSKGPDSAHASYRPYPNGTPLSLMMPDGDGIKTGDAGPFLSVASYNLLAPVYVRPYDKRTGGIQHFAAFEWISDEDSESVLGIKQRGPRLLSSLRKSGADVVCLQELQLERDTDGSDERDGDQSKGRFVLPLWIRPIEEDYEVYLPPHAELEVIAERNVRVLGVDAAVVCAIIYRKDRLEAIQEACKGSKDVDTSTCVSLCLKGKVGSLLESIEPLVVTSVHLDATDERKRVGQLARCLRRARNLEVRGLEGKAERLQPISTLIAGDMNQEFFMGSCVHGFLVDGAETKATDSDLERECASAHRLDRGQVPTKEQLKEWGELYADARKTAREYCVSLSRINTGATRCAYDHTEKVPNASPSERHFGQWRLDHILHTLTTLQPCAYWSTLEDDSETCAIGLPNRRIGSDHMPIGAVFRVLPRPQLSDVEKALVLDSMHKLSKRHKKDFLEQQAALDANLAAIEAKVMPQGDCESSKGKRNKKGARPPEEIVDFMRTKRIILKEVRTKQREERCALVKGYGDLQRLLIEQTFGYSASQWVERG